MNKFDLIRSLMKLVEEKEKRNERIDRKADELGAEELKKRIEELECLYPGQGRAMHELLQETLGEELKISLTRLVKFARIAPHSLADYAFDVAIYVLKGSIETVQIEKEAEFKRREELKELLKQEVANEKVA
jgi:hypothetical protein